MSKRVLFLLLAALPLVGSAGTAPAGQLCVTVVVTAPVLGTRQVARCQPEPFGHTFWGTNCQGVPPVGVSECVSYRVDLPI